MWLDRLKELKAQTGMSNKMIAEKTFSSEKTIDRIFSGKNDNPYIDTLDRIAKAFGSSLDYIFSDTKVVIGEQNLATLQENLNTSVAEIELLKAELDLLKAENNVLKDKNVSLSTENDLLRIKLEHKDEVIALHNYYNKRLAKE